ncbi:MAG: hypothetical protein U1E89_18105 [Burkholderiaceae bacterium]
MAWLAAAHAQGLAEPAGAVVLAISGKITHANRGATAVFDMDMLAALPQHSVTTRTPWFAQPRKFTGPLLRDVLALAGAQGQTLRVGALNDYRIDIPFDDVHHFDVVLARLLDDTPMTVREKGPLFMIYPFDSVPALRSPRYYSRSVWQLISIEVQ